MLLLIGFTATVAQILLMRELLVVFYGNEISLGLLLASWLLWTSAGSSLFGRASAWLNNPRKVMAGLQTLLALTLPLTILAVRSAKGLFITVPGEMLGPWPMLLTALVVLCPFCLFSGGAFSVGSRLVEQETAAAAASATGSVYLLEAIGSGIGGLAASLVLVRQYTSFQVAFAVGMLNLLAAASLIVHKPLWRRIAYGAVIVAFAVGVIPFGAPRMEIAFAKPALARISSAGEPQFSLRKSGGGGDGEQPHSAGERPGAVHGARSSGCRGSGALRAVAASRAAQRVADRRRAEWERRRSSQASAGRTGRCGRTGSQDL